MTPEIKSTIEHFKNTISELTKDKDIPFKLNAVATIDALNNGLNEDEQKTMKKFLGMCLYAKYCPLYKAKLVSYLCHEPTINQKTFYHVILKPNQLMQAKDKSFRNTFTHQDIKTLFKNIDYLFRDYQDEQQFYFDHVYIK